MTVCFYEVLSESSVECEKKSVRVLLQPGWRLPEEVPGQQHDDEQQQGQDQDSWEDVVASGRNAL